MYDAIDPNEKLRKLVKQFQLGINRFEVESAGQTTEIVFQAEL